MKFFDILSLLLHKFFDPRNPSLTRFNIQSYRDESGMRTFSNFLASCLTLKLILAEVD